MNKVTLKYLSFLAFAPLAVGCAEDNIFGEENLDKTKPSVEILVEKYDRFSIKFEIRQSDDSQQFAYAVCEKSDTLVEPAPYDLLSGNVDTKVTGIFNEADYRDYYFSSEVFIEAGKTYIIYASSINSEGVLSLLSRQEIAIPAKVKFKDGIYYTQGADMSTGAPGDPTNPKSGEKFISSLQFVPYTTEDYLVYQANWFNIIDDSEGEGKIVGVPLIGVIDYDKKTVNFDGRFVDVNGGFSPSTSFGMAFYPRHGNYEEDKEWFVLWGGGDSGLQDIVMTFDDAGNITDISHCMVAIHDITSGGMVETFDILKDAKMTFDRDFPEDASSDGSLARISEETLRLGR